MKTEILTKQDSHPIELKITIETKRELEFFYCLFGASGSSLADFANKTQKSGVKYFEPHEVNNFLIWEQLHNLNIVK